MSSLTPFERFASDIESNYGITPIEISPAPRGFSADTYFVNTEKESFFLKIMNNPGRQNSFIHGLRVVDALASRGIDYITRVVKLSSGELHFKKDNSACALYTRIDGKQSYNYNREDAFRKLANIYRVSQDFPDKDKFISEGYNDWFIGAYEKEINNFMNDDIEGSEALEVKAMLKPYANFLESCPATARKIISECRKQKATFYLTHSDFPGNVMITETGEQYLIDFDEAIFGPLERDSWLCVASENEESKLWMSVMREVFPDYSVNKIFMCYYIYERFMIDLIGFTRELLNNPDAEYRRRIVNSTRDYMLGWLYPITLKYKDSI